MNRNSDKETKSDKFELHAVFLDGRVLFLTDDTSEIFSYIDQWKDLIDYVILKKIL